MKSVAKKILETYDKSEALEKRYIIFNLTGKSNILGIMKELKNFEASLTKKVVMIPEIFPLFKVMAHVPGFEPITKDQYHKSQTSLSSTGPPGQADGNHPIALFAQAMRKHGAEIQVGGETTTAKPTGSPDVRKVYK